MRNCPRCNAEVLPTVTVCPGCHVALPLWPVFKKGWRLARGGWLIVFVVVGGLGLQAYYRSTSVAGMDYAQAAHVIELLESDRVLSGKHCDGTTTTARFSRRAWLQLTEDRQLVVMRVISRVCSERGQAVPVKLLDDRTGDVLDNFDGDKIIR